MKRKDLKSTVSICTGPHGSFPATFITNNSSVLLCFKLVALTVDANLDVQILVGVLKNLTGLRFCAGGYS